MASPDLPWPEAIELWRGRLAAIELALEQSEQLLLEHAVGVVGHGEPDRDAACHNLGALGLAAALATPEIAVLMRAAFETAAPP